MVYRVWEADNAPIFLQKKSEQSALCSDVVTRTRIELVLPP